MSDPGHTGNIVPLRRYSRVPGKSNLPFDEVIVNRFSYMLACPHAYINQMSII